MAEYIVLRYTISVRARRITDRYRALAELRYESYDSCAMETPRRARWVLNHNNT